MMSPFKKGLALLLLGYFLPRSYASYLMCTLYRSDSKNSRSSVSLLHGTMERVRFPAGAGVDPGHLDGRHHDRPSDLANLATSRPSVQDRENFKTD